METHFTKKHMSIADLMALKPALRKHGLHTVCESASCPNIGECFAKRQATFLIAGDICTRGCAFCAISAGRPLPPDAGEPARVAAMAKDLALRYVVVTSVTRDDLPDGGAMHFCATVAALRTALPQSKVEILVPDFQGNWFAARTVFACKPDVFSHNIETVPRLYETARVGAGYERSLELLAKAKRAGLCTKSGLMLGLGETLDEVRQAMKDLRTVRCDMLTLGQYLPPHKHKLPVQRYATDDEFAALKEEAAALGFTACASGPFVRSSYLAESYFPGGHPQ